MIKVFTTTDDGKRAGDILTEEFEKWMALQSNPIKIVGFHTNSNKFGWMLTVQYEKI